VFGDMAWGGLVIPADIDQLLVTVCPDAFNLFIGFVNTVIPLFAGESNETEGQTILTGCIRGNTSSLTIENFPQLLIDSIVIDFSNVEHSLLLLAFLVVPRNEFLHIRFTDFLEEKFNTEILMVISALNSGA